MDNKVKFVKCTKEQYDKLTDKDSDTIYVVTNETLDTDKTKSPDK